MYMYFKIYIVHFYTPFLVKILKRRQCDLDWCVWRELSILQRHLCRSNVTRPTLLNLGQTGTKALRDERLSTRPFETR